MQKFVLTFSVLQVKSIQIKIDFHAFIFFQKDSYIVRILILFNLIFDPLVNIFDDPSS